MTGRPDTGNDRPPREDEAPVFELRPRTRRVQRSDDGPQELSDLIMPTLARLGLKTKARYLQVLGAWDEVVGEQVAAGARPTYFDRGRLQVETNSPALGHQLQLQAQMIVDKLNEAIGDRVVTNIRFRMAGGR
ncbi:MAG: DciA family protein [Candidatus Dormibacteria bacterium]